MTPEDITKTGAEATVIGAAIAGLALGLRKAWLMWKTDGATGAEIDARKELVNQLRAELSRMAVQNNLLATELNKLQLSVSQMNQQLHELTDENAALRTQIERLRAEITRLPGASARPAP